MNIREAIDRLTVLAGEMPDEFDTEVRVAMCDGANLEVTSALVIDSMWEIEKDMRTPKGQYVTIQGHPHRDGTSTVLREVAADADEQLRRWAQEDE